MKEAFSIKRAAHNIKYDIHRDKRDVKKYSLKLNAGIRKFGGAWQLHLNKEMYLVLKQDIMKHWSKYNVNIKNINLKGDTLMELKN